MSQFENLKMQLNIYLKYKPIIKRARTTKQENIQTIISFLACESSCLSKNFTSDKSSFVGELIENKFSKSLKICQTI